MADDFSIAQRLRLSTSPDLSTWTPLDHAVVRAVEWGTAMDPGSATVECPWGPAVTWEGSVVALSAPLIANLVGLFARIERETAPSTWTAAGWHGTITGGQVRNLLDGRGVTTLRLEDLTSLFHRRLATRAQVLRADGSGLISLHRWPTITQNRSSSTFSVNGSSVHVPVLPGFSNSLPWTPATLLASLVAHHWPAGWPAVSFVGLPAYDVPDMDLWGRSIGDVLNSLVGVDRGYTYRASVSGTTIVVTCLSLSASTITIGTGSLPANPEQAPLDLTTDLDIYELSGDESWQQQADETIVACDEGGQVGLTLAWKIGDTGSLRQGWASTSDAYAFRRFRIWDQWDGLSDTAADGLRHDLTISAGAYTGARTTGLTPRNGVRLTPAIPMPEDAANFLSKANWHPERDRKQPLVIVEWGANKYEDVSARIRLHIDGEAGTIDLGDSPEDRLQVQLWLSHAQAIYVSLTAHEWAPTQASALAASPVSHRQNLLRIPGPEIRMAQGALYATTPTTLTRVTTAGGEIIRTQQASVCALAAALASQEGPQVSLRWAKRGLHTTWQPGSMLSAMVATGLNGLARPVITRRAWEPAGSDSWRTVWQAASRPVELRGDL